MGLTNAREEQLKKQPIIEAKLSKSADGKFVIHRTVITHIKPVHYYQAVLSDRYEEEE